MIGFIVLLMISLLPLVVVWITSPEDIFMSKNEISKEKPKIIFQKKQPKKLTNKGKLFFLIALITATLSWLQFDENEETANALRTELALRDSLNREEIRLRDKASIELQLSRDSINNENVRRRDSISYKIVEQGKNETIVALGQYSLRYDSSQNRIEKLVKDSAKKVVYLAEEPNFQARLGSAIQFIDSTDIEYRFSLTFCSYVASSSRYNIQYYVGFLESINGQCFYLYKETPFPMSMTLPKDGVGMTKFTTPKVSKDGLVVVLVKGTFSNLDGSKTFPLQTVLYYDFKRDYSGLFRGGTEKRITDYLQQF